MSACLVLQLGTLTGTLIKSEVSQVIVRVSAFYFWKCRLTDLKADYLYFQK